MQAALKKIYLIDPAYPSVNNLNSICFIVADRKNMSPHDNRCICKTKQKLLVLGIFW